MKRCMMLKDAKSSGLREKAQVLLLPLLLTWMTILSLDFSVCKIRKLGCVIVTKYWHNNILYKYFL